MNSNKDNLIIEISNILSGLKNKEEIFTFLNEIFEQSIFCFDDLLQLLLIRKIRGRRGINEKNLEKRTEECYYNKLISYMEVTR